MATKLTAKRQRFVEEYQVDGNATKAAIRAGFSEKTAYSQGQRLLKNVEVVAVIIELQEKRSQRTEITADWVIENLKENHKLARQSDDISASTKALEIIGKHLGMFTTNIKLSGDKDNPVEHHGVCDLSDTALAAIIAKAKA